MSRNFVRIHPKRTQGLMPLCPFLFIQKENPPFDDSPIRELSETPLEPTPLSFE